MRRSVVLAAAVACASTEAIAQPFCLRMGCESRPLSHYASAADAPTGGAVASAAWTRGFAQLESGTVGLFLGTSDARPQPLPSRLGMTVAAGFNAMGAPIDERSPLAVGRVAAGEVFVSTNRGGRVVTGASRTAIAVQSGLWSEPSMACAGTSCVGAVSDNDNRTTLFFFDAATVQSRPLSFGPTGAVVGVLTTRPAIVAIGPNRYLLIRRHVEGGEERLRIYEVDGTRPALPPVMVAQSPPTSFQAGAPIAASSFGASVLVAWAKQPSLAVYELAAMAVMTQPVLGSIGSAATLVRRPSPFTALGVARAEGSFVVTWQEGGELFRMPVQSVLVGGDRYGVAHRPADTRFDRVGAAVIASSHRVASGPKALLVFDELSAPATSATPRAMGYVMDSCSAPGECALTLGATWAGMCLDGVCVPMRPMDAGVDAGPDASADAEASVDVSVDVRADAEASVDVVTMGDAAEADVAAGDALVASDVATRRDVVADDADPNAGEGVLAVTGGACGCRTSANAGPSLWPTLFGAAAALVALRRRKAS